MVEGFKEEGLRQRVYLSRIPRTSFDERCTHKTTTSRVLAVLAHTSVTGGDVAPASSSPHTHTHTHIDHAEIQVGGREARESVVDRHKGVSCQNESEVAPVLAGLAEAGRHVCLAREYVACKQSALPPQRLASPLLSVEMRESTRAELKPAPSTAPHRTATPL